MKKLVLGAALLLACTPAVAETLFVTVDERPMVTVEAPQTFTVSVSWYEDHATAEEVHQAVLACGYGDAELSFHSDIDPSFLSVVRPTGDTCVTTALAR